MCHGLGMESARDRLARFISDEGLSQARAGELFGCSQGLISKILRGERTPGRQLANRIADATGKWRHGPIASREWDAIELGRRDKAPASPAEPLKATGTDNGA